MERIECLRNDGRTLVMVTHDPRFAARAADRAIVLAAGRIGYQSQGPLDAEELERQYFAASEPPS